MRQYDDAEIAAILAQHGVDHDKVVWSSVVPAAPWADTVIVRYRLLTVGEESQHRVYTEDAVVHPG